MKRALLWGLGVLIVGVVVAVAAGPWFYREFIAGVASIASPESARDGQFRGQDILDVDKFPTAELRVTRPVDVAAVPETGASATLDVPISMTIKGVSRDVTAKVDVQRTGDTIIAAGSVPVTWTDFDVTPPDFAGFVKVEPTGTIEFLVNLRKGVTG